MSVSGFSDQFLFYGFLPKTEKELEKVLIICFKLSIYSSFFIPSKKLNFYIKKIKNFFQEEKI